MNNKLRLEGIYSSETISYIEEKNIKDFGFDFRPMSLNFIQHYKYLEILEETHNSKQLHWLHFENEHPDIIKKLLLDSKDILDKKGQVKGSLLLEFSDNQKSVYYDQFNNNFAWNYVDMESLKEVIKSKHLKVLILPFSEIEHLQNTSKFHDFVASFHKTTFESFHNNKIKLALKMDWDSNIFPSLFEFIKFDFCSLGVNQKVETSFRKIDWKKFDDSLNYYLKLDI